MQKTEQTQVRCADKLAIKGGCAWIASPFLSLFRGSARFRLLSCFGSGFCPAFGLPAPAFVLLSASRSRLPGPGHGPAPLLSLFAVPLGCPSWLSLLTAPPGYWARTFFSISSTMRRNALSVSIRFDTALHEWSTVAWLRPPMAAPMVVSGALVCCLARYMAI